MSEENVERIRDGYAAFNRHDYEAAVETFHPDAVWHPYLGSLESDVYRGRDAILAMWREFDKGFGGSLKVEPREYIDLGDQVAVVVEAHATGSESGAEVSQSWVQLWSLRDGLVIHVEPFPDREAALEAADQR
jgi:ketosteroid isomerase-like protein